MKTSAEQLKDILTEISVCRTRVMDDCELELAGDKARWNMLRSRLLKIFGTRGLEGKVTEILSPTFQGDENDNIF